MAVNPCLTCGACCAYYRNSFYWAEGEDATPGGVPLDMTQDVPPYHRVMRGTRHTATPRCVALRGEIGDPVYCSIYDRRPSPCRDFTPSWQDGQPNERCDQARAAHGLRPLLPGDYIEPPDTDLRPAA